MKNIRRKSGITIIETTVVAALIALLSFVAVPAIKSMMRSMVTEGSTRAMVEAAVQRARTIAIKERRYAGLRFQEKFDPASAVDKQYMIFVIWEDMGSFKNGFKAVEGAAPISLPENYRVMDRLVRTNYGVSTNDSENGICLDVAQPQLDATNTVTIYGKVIQRYINDMMAFTILFGPNGKLITDVNRPFKMRCREGFDRPLNLNDSCDDMFNSPENIVNNSMGTFIQDDYGHYGLGAEFGRNNFVIVEKTVFDKMTAPERYDYLFDDLQPIYINPNTGKALKR
jgi:type II secretory pathway pseudopilin PulG